MITIINIYVYSNICAHIREERCKLKRDPVWEILIDGGLVGDKKAREHPIRCHTAFPEILELQIAVYAGQRGAAPEADTRQVQRITLPCAP